MEYNWVFFRFSIFGFMSANTLAMILSPGSILECQMVLKKFATSHITENLRFESTMLKFKVKKKVVFFELRSLSLAPWTTRPFWQFENVTYDWLSFVNLTRCSWHIIINNDTCQGIADLTTRTMDVKQKPLLLTTSLTNKRKFSIDLKGIKTIWVHLH